MEKLKCPKCGSFDLRETTEFNKARCHIQFLINPRLFCYDCQSETIKNRLDNPIKSCDDCFGTSTCPASSAAAEATKQNHSCHRPKSPESTGKYRRCERGETPRPGKSGYGPSTRNAIHNGSLRYNEVKDYWEKLISD